MNPEGEFSDPQSDDNIEEVIEHKQGVTTGPALVVLLAGVCLAVVFWFIYMIWTTPEPAPAPAPTPVEDTELLPAPDLTNVPGRDSAVLGLRIDTKLGRFFTIPKTGQTLYVATEECTNTCLEDWTPHTAKTVIENDSDLGTTERPDGTLQYTWKGQALYTFNLDTDRSVYGDGYDGTWRIAKP